MIAGRCELRLSLIWQGLGRSLSEFQGAKEDRKVVDDTITRPQVLAGLRSSPAASQVRRACFSTPLIPSRGPRVPRGAFVYVMPRPRRACAAAPGEGGSCAGLGAGRARLTARVACVYFVISKKKATSRAKFIPELLNLHPGLPLTRTSLVLMLFFSLPRFTPLPLRFHSSFSFFGVTFR